MEANHTMSNQHLSDFQVEKGSLYESMFDHSAEHSKQMYN